MVPIPTNEHFRLEVFRTLDLPEKNQSHALGELAGLAAQIFDVPMALVSVIDESRQRALSAVGMDAVDIPRSGSICAHTLTRDNVLVVTDAALDDRFHQCDLVTGPPYIRFYAGAPLVLPEGFVIGTFCVMDRRPRPSFGEASKEQLADLAGAALKNITGYTDPGADCGEPETSPAWLAPTPALAITKDARFSAFADLAHDICSGLDEIKQASDALDTLPLSGDQRQLQTLIEQIQASTSYVHGITGRTLDLARLRAGAVGLNETIVDVVDILDATLSRGRGLAHEHGVTLASQPMKLRPKILADAGLLEQMVTNLMTNAIVHSRPGSSAHCAISSAPGGELVMAMHNDGAFLTDGEIDSAFEPFHVIGGGGDRRTAGLGLPITRKLIELHGGSIDLNASPDEGIEARLLFPAYRVLTWYSRRENLPSASRNPSTI